MLTDTQRDSWNRDGFLLMPGFLAAAATEALDGWVAEIASWPPQDDRWMHHYEQIGDQPRLARSEFLIAFHDGIRRLLTEGAVPETAAALLGEPVVLYKEKINYKYPGGGGYAAHQDAPAYAHADRHITCSIAVDAANAANGCLAFAPGLHTRGRIATDDQGCIAPAVAEDLPWVDVPMHAGDALFFGSYAPHRSTSNRTAAPRRSLYLTYNAAADGDHRETYYRDKRRALAHRGSEERGSAKLSTIGHFLGKAVKDRG